MNRIENPEGTGNVIIEFLLFISIIGIPVLLLREALFNRDTYKF